MDVLIKRALVFGVYIRAPDCWKLPNGGAMKRLAKLVLWLLSAQRGLAVADAPGQGVADAHDAQSWTFRVVITRP